VTGANRGIGLAIATELAAHGARIIAINRSDSEELRALKPEEVILGIDVQNDEQCEGIKDQIKGGPIDIVSSCLVIVRRSAFNVLTISPFVAHQQRWLLLQGGRDDRFPQLSRGNQDD